MYTSSLNLTPRPQSDHPLPTFTPRPASCRMRSPRTWLQPVSLLALLAGAAMSTADSSRTLTVPSSWNSDQAQTQDKENGHKGDGSIKAAQHIPDVEMTAGANISAPDQEQAEDTIAVAVKAIVEEAQAAMQPAVQLTEDESLTTATEYPAMPTLQEVPRAELPRAMRILIDTMAWCNSAQLRAFRHPGVESKRAAWNAAAWLRLLPALLF